MGEGPLLVGLDLFSSPHLSYPHQSTQYRNCTSNFFSKPMYLALFFFGTVLSVPIFVVVLCVCLYLPHGERQGLLTRDGWRS